MEPKPKSKITRNIIIVLAVLLTLSLAALGVVLFGNKKEVPPTYVVVPDNVIASETVTIPSEPMTSISEPPLQSDEAQTTVPPMTATPTTAAPTTAALTTAAPTTAAPTTAAPTTAALTTPAPTTAKPADKPAAPKLALYSGHAQDNVPFKAENLLPGDVISKEYCVRVSHEGAVTVSFHAELRSDADRLAKVLKTKIVLGETVLYDGLMKDMPPALTAKLTATAQTDSDLIYEVTVYLETSVGNEYMNQKLIADYRWWVEDSGNLTPPKTGDSAQWLLWISMGAVALLAVILLLIALRRGKRHEE